MNFSERNLKVYDRILATFSIVSVILGGIWSFTGYLDAKEAENTARKEQVRLNIFNEKKALYYELSDAEAEIAACNSYEEVVIAQKHFKKLYCGRAHIISSLDRAVNRQKIHFRKLLDKYLDEKPKTTPFEYFGQASLDLVDSCKAKLVYQ